MEARMRKQEVNLESGLSMIDAWADNNSSRSNNSYHIEQLK